ncbi:MAG: hypothetical protein PVG39_02050 [Desulfobacteraceae bacterium]|jgi:hypothetical protein
MEFLRKALCKTKGHTPDTVITGFRNKDARAIGRCARCGVPIILEYYAAPYLFNIANKSLKQTETTGAAESEYVPPLLSSVVINER